MRISDSVANYILQLLQETNGTAEIQRNELASYLGCVPSQINYVITSRFTPEQGYLVESRRGGGGYIRIIRKQMGHNEYLMHFFHAIGNEIDEREANAYLHNLADNGLLTKEAFRLCRAALSGQALAVVPQAQRSAVRARIFRQMVLAMMSE